MKYIVALQLFSKKVAQKTCLPNAAHNSPTTIGQTTNAFWISLRSELIKLRSMSNAKLILSLTFFLMPLTSLLAQGEVESATNASSIPQELIWLLMLSAIVIAFTCLVLAVTVWVLITHQEEKETEGARVLELPKFLQPGYIWKKLNDAVPVTQEASIDMGHDYDGIRELDNNLPPWWKYGFYASIVFAVIYMFVYHGSGDWSSTQEYEEVMAIAAKEKAARLASNPDQVDENSVVLVTDAASLASGQNIYNLNCLACHGASGEGGIGPNLTDEYWLYGGSISDIFSTIKYGVPEKGMISWQTMLKPEQMQNVASYIYSFQGTSPPNAKEPQGELYKPDASAEESTPTDSSSVVMN